MMMHGNEGIRRLRRRLATLVPGLILVCLTVLAGTAHAMPAPPKDAKCPVCGMFVAKYANWSCSLSYQGGARLYFDGPKDLFNYYLNPERYDPSRKRSDIATIEVKDYYSLAAIDARRAWFVTGSDIRGPMGNELIPFAKKADAEAFLRDHRGKRLFRFKEVTPAVLKSLE